MSPRTVEYHLHKVLTKLAISSRNQLRARPGQPQKRGTGKSPLALIPNVRPWGWQRSRGVG
jgi:hypothetical protein